MNVQQTKQTILGRLCVAGAAALLLTLASVVGVDAQQESAVAAVVGAYHDALAEGDSTTALNLLAEDVIILESGGLETKEHYRSGHLAGDMSYAQAVSRERGEINVTISGNVAWANSLSTVQGMRGDREINSVSAELMVLERVDGSWMIKAIHWSSRQRR